ncbi:hypothetical protein NQD34_013904 [Periophthalmus magnuspinnatus]|nr:hypothetical protein NQD34_013904 [Periophthalmus magnuspinnatus]
MTLPLRRAGMASSGNLSEEQVHCSICLDVFTNPVSIPCGHNFCQNCILGYWKTSPLYQCPMCKKAFQKRPDISVNTVLREIAEQFKQIRVKSRDGKVEKEEDEIKTNKTKDRKWTTERRKKEDEVRLLEKDQFLEELKEKQEQRKLREDAKAEEDLPPLIPPIPPPRSPPVSRTQTSEIPTEVSPSPSPPMSSPISESSPAASTSSLAPSWVRRRRPLRCLFRRRSTQSHQILPGLSNFLL